MLKTQWGVELEVFSVISMLSGVVEDVLGTAKNSSELEVVVGVGQANDENSPKNLAKV